MSEVSDDASTGRRQGVAECDRSAVDIGFVSVEFERSLARDVLRRKGFVNLNEVHV